MVNSLIAEIVFCACIFVMNLSPARADGGRINFSGAVVAPTCSLTTADIPKVGVTALRTLVDTDRLKCAKSGNGAGSSPQIFVFTAERLSSSVPDRVLQYFYAYVKASRVDAADPMLVIQTYA